MNEIKDFKEFRKAVKDQNYIYCDLINSDGKKLINRNRLKPDFENNLTKIFNKLESSVTSPGSFFIRCWVSPAGEPETFVYHKGGVKSLSDYNEAPKTITIIEKEKPAKSPDVLTYEKALEYQNTIAQLTYQNEALTQRVKDLEEELAEIEEEEEDQEEEKQIAENNPMNQISKTLENIIATAMPVLDRHYKYKEDKLKLEWAKITGGSGRTIEHQANQQPQKSPIEQLEERVNAWLDKISQENQELYAKLEEMSTQVTTLEDYLQAIQKNYPEKYLELEKFVTQN